MDALTATVAEADGTTSTVDIPVERIVNCGFTGRDEAAVRAHIEELEAEGVTVPAEFPVLYPKPRHLLATGGEIEVLSDRTSGEAEFALFPTEGETYVGVGSDHTDRDLEREDIVVSKAVCPNVVGDTVWRLSDVRDHWDEVRLRSWTGSREDPDLYQDDTLGSILPPAEIRELVADGTTTPVEGTAMFSGSVGTLGGELVCGDVFVVELDDPVLDRTLRVEYGVDVVDWLA